MAVAEPNAASRLATRPEAERRVGSVTGRSMTCQPGWMRVRGGPGSETVTVAENCEVSRGTGEAPPVVCWVAPVRPGPVEPAVIVRIGGAVDLDQNDGVAGVRGAAGVGMSCRTAGGIGLAETIQGDPGMRHRWQREGCRR